MLERETQRQVYGFIITKPLQLMIVLAIIKQLPEKIHKELLIIDFFADAEKVSIKLSEIIDSTFSVIFLKDDIQAFNLSGKKKYKKLFMDSDVGFFRNLTLFNLKIRSIKTIFCTYEEGIGTYRNDLYFGVKRTFLKIIGCGVNFGGNWLTRELYVYNIDEVPLKKSKTRIVRINKNIQNLIEEDKYFLAYVFDDYEFLNEFSKFNNYNCLVYLSSWDIDLELFDLLKSIRSECFVKLHPHIKIQLERHVNFHIIDSRIPAEIFLSNLSFYCNKILVIHHGSSVDRYIKNEKIEFITANKFKDQYRSNLMNIDW